MEREKIHIAAGCSPCSEPQRQVTFNIQEVTCFSCIQALSQAQVAAQVVRDSLHLKCLGCHDAAPCDKFDHLQSQGWWWSPPSISPEYPYLLCPECRVLMREALGITIPADYGPDCVKCQIPMHKHPAKNRANYYHCHSCGDWRQMLLVSCNPPR